MVSPGSWFVGEVSRQGDWTRLDRVAAEHAGSRILAPCADVRVIVAAESATCTVWEESDREEPRVESDRKAAPCIHVCCGSVFVDTPGGRALLADAPRGRASLAGASGQFAALDISPSGALTLRTDENGLRSVFVMRRGNRVLFATHLHLLTRLAGRLAANPERFGSHWFSWCQLSSESFIDGVERIAGGEQVDIQISGGDDSPAVHVLPPGPSAKRDAGGGAAAKTALDGIQSGLRELGARGVLALSGGIDSRLLLATGAIREAFVFGSDADPDVIIAREAATVAGMECTVIPDASLASLIGNGLLEQYARDNMCISTITAAAHMGNYPLLAERFPGRVLVDGGFGEIGRAQYLQRFELLRRLFWLRLGGLDACVSALASVRCDVFAPAVRRRMEEGVRRDVERFMEELARLDAAPSDAVRAEDDLAARYRRQNFFGHGQAWIDAFVPNYMPLAQEPFVQYVLRSPLRERRASRAVRAWIAKENARLARVHRSARGTLVPFGVPPILVPAARRVRRAAAHRHGRASITESNTESNPLLHRTVRELVYDTCLSPRPWYEPAKVRSLVEGFYSGNMHLAPAVAWLLSLELWLRGNDLEA